MKIKYEYCPECDKREDKGAVKTDKICWICKRNLLYKVELDFKEKV